MKPIVNVDSRGAGEGKTTTGIYRALKISHRFLEMPVLLVVPSIRLQQQYQEGIPDIIHKDDIINSDNTTNVVGVLLDRMKEPRNSQGRPRVICITHEAFRRTNIHRTLRSGWCLIVDEVMDPWSYEKINLQTAKSWQPDYNFKDLFYWARPERVVAEDDEVFHELLVGAIPDNVIFGDSPQWQRLTSLNHRLWIREPAYQRLCQQGTGYVELIVSLHERIFEDWAYLTIAAAAFEHTFLHHWFQCAGFEIHTERPFVKQKRNIRLHTMALPDGLKWSNRKRNLYPEILNDYHAYVNANLPKPILGVRNNAEGRRLIDEVKLGHNAHGNNDYTEYTAISLETALVVTPTLNEFYTRQIGLTESQVITAFPAYIFYQLIMRTALRVRGNTQTVDVAILDHQSTVELANFLDWPIDDTLQNITTTWKPPQKPTGRPRRNPNGPVMTSRERNKLWRERQNKLANDLFEVVKEDIDKT